MIDDFIHQIRDWLTLIEQMSRQQTAVVGDAEDVRRLIEKHKVRQCIQSSGRESPQLF